ncbi:MAG: hypothetical protein RSD78_06615 [Oscillospiraceae bacterium]
MYNQAYWNAFESTGQIDYYLRYKAETDYSHNAEEIKDADNHDGACYQRS